MALEILFNIGLSNGLLTIWCLAITWTNTDLLLIGTGFSQFNLNQSNTIFIKDNVFHNIVCKIILFMPVCVGDILND